MRMWPNDQDAHRPVVARPVAWGAPMTVGILGAIWLTVLVIVFLTAATVTETWTEALRAGVLLASVTAALVALWWAVLA